MSLPDRGETYLYVEMRERMYRDEGFGYGGDGTVRF